MLGYVAICVGTALLFLDVYLVYISLGFRKTTATNVKVIQRVQVNIVITMLEGKLEDSISIIWNMYMYIV